MAWLERCSASGKMPMHTGEWRNGRRIGLKIRSDSSVKPESAITSEDGPDVLADCLAFLGQEMPDLAAVVSAWPRLPEAVKAGILAMVKAMK